LIDTVALDVIPTAVVMCACLEWM